MIATERHVGQLREIPPSQIQKNPENPRIYFRPEELASLMASIAKYGVQVPISVYKDGDHYTLIDGERRWRCADKLNLPKIPALVQPKPSALGNLLLMFNIHALREQWDYLTIATKLPSVIELFVGERGFEPNEIQLSEATGLTRGQIRRCRFLLNLPGQYIDILLDELSLPKQKQRLSEDFFIEMERALKAVQNRLPDAITDINAARDTLIQKFREKKINNITDFRKLSKIATSVDKFEVGRHQAAEAVRVIFDSESNVGISDIFAEHYEMHYDERKVELSIRSVSAFLETVEETEISELSVSFITQLRNLRDLLDRILEEA
jgi:ParB/RepB/Spo0J family partition protein